MSRRLQMAGAREIKVLGPGCPKCTTLFQNVETAVRELNVTCAVAKVTDINEIMSFGVMMTPALVIDGEVRALGRVPSVDAIKELLE